MNRGPIFYRKPVCIPQHGHHKKQHLAQFLSDDYTTQSLPVFYYSDNSIRNVRIFRYVGQSNAIWDQEAYVKALQGKFIKITILDKECYLVSTFDRPNKWICADFLNQILISSFHLALRSKKYPSILSDSSIIWFQKIDGELTVEDWGTLRSPSQNVRQHKLDFRIEAYQSEGQTYYILNSKIPFRVYEYKVKYKKIIEVWQLQKRKLI